MYPVLFKLGPLTFFSKGLFTMLGIIAGMWFLYREFKKRGLDPEMVYPMGIAATIGGVVGARLFYVIGRWPEFSGDLISILALQSGGLVWYGGLTGGILACLWVLKKGKAPIAVIADLSAPAIALGYAVGRIGCFLNGDSYGKPSDLPWALAFPQGSPPTLITVHPTQIYEILLSLLIFATLLKFREKFKFTGQVLWFYLALAGTERFLIEFWRINQVIFAGLTIYQYLSIGMVLAAIIAIYWPRSEKSSYAVNASNS